MPKKFNPEIYINIGDFYTKKSRLVLSGVVLVVVILLGSLPLGPLPPLFSLLNPSTGVWATEPSYSTGVTTFTLTQGNNHALVTVYREPDGFIGIASNETWAVYYEQGYLEAEYRLAQMEFLLLTATGNLSTVLGKSALSSDIFFRELGDYQIAQQEVANLSPTSYTYMAVSEFVKGINDYIASVSPARLPLLFKLLGYRPTNWTITDVFALQQLFLWENTASQFDPLYFTFALEKMPPNVVRAFYPAYPEGIQHPIVPNSLNPGIYTESGDVANLSLYTPSYFYPLNASPPDPPTLPLNLTVGTGYCAINIPQLLLSLRDLGSNDWAVNSPLTGGSGLLASDPHLSTTVPSIWIGFQLVSPGQNVVGVVFPGFPGIVLGHNPYIAWGATNGQIQQTYFYAEETSPSHPGQYFWNGEWVNFSVTNETIYVKGSAPYHLQVLRARNGVVIQTSPVTIAMDWVGLQPTYELTFFLRVDRATSVLEFQSIAEQYFKVATQNWAVADSRGNIGIFSYGLFPIISQGDPRGILPGTGQYDWEGFVPIQYQPSLYDPPTGFVFSANQITVSPGYPFYLGWDYESGMRANEIYTVLSQLHSANLTAMEELQLNVHDFSTNVFLKPLLTALAQAGYNDTPEYQALSQWNGDMYANSTAATIYYFWLINYISYVFKPWLLYYNITPSEGLGSVSFFLGPDDYYHGPLVEDLENWTVNYPNITWFSNPITKVRGNASYDMVQAYLETVKNLTSTLGNFSSAWEWGNLHKRVLSSFFGIQALNTVELPASGDGNTVDASYGLVSSFGPSWRLVVNMSDPLDGQGIYPGGVTENPVSPYYSNTFEPWNDGVYYTLIPSNVPPQFLYLYQEGIEP
ncbi:penicillin amidase [Metallosphaera sedula]|uniref:Penicillin amidase n=1 Tax=Metallosphaera sedula TaxID=43687 RepID=A0A0K1SYN0_9CREN|nr:penicillin amidase [Metallosphaera sedula]AKV77574.1 penicillin amidase [Metallosphaera sedula]AKV79819.1 penicillin amidase [Metallosphaera sedula]AKV82064.1 penicillin amidase [Metallosphaera sedula]AKV84307.1 penicillin amidase [Metallosphaera sedula]